MRSKVFISVFVALTMLLCIGATVKDAKADALMFPYVVRSTTVTTLISVVNTAESVSEACGLPFSYPGRLHWEYFYKESIANGQTEICLEHDFDSTSSKDDMVTFDIAGVWNAGLAMFNDLGSIPIFVADFTLPVDNPRRAFLLVDNNTNAYFDDDAGFQTNLDGTLYGEAMIIERESGAAVGYIAYNAVGGVKNDDTDLNLAFNDDDHRDILGEVIGDDDTGECEMSPITILPPALVTTKLLVTPTGSSNNDGKDGACDSNNQRLPDLNVVVRLCASPNEDIDDCDCPAGGGGIWNNTEGKISFSVNKNIVCVAADVLQAFMGATAYNSFYSSGKAGWTYVDVDRGTLAGSVNEGPFCETDEAVIMKVEIAEGDTVFNGATVTDAPFGVDNANLVVNNLVWLRNNRNYIDWCDDDTNNDNWRCDSDRGLNFIHNQTADCPLGP